MNRLLVLGAFAAVAAVCVALRPAPAPQAVALLAASPPPRAWHRQPSNTGVPADVVYVAGAVARPGLYRLSASARVDDAVGRAGGFASDADPASINLAEHVSDGEEIRVLRAGEAVPKTPRARKSRSRKKRHHAGSAAASAPIDLNTADADTLASLPGVGPTLAQRIVDFRQVNGSFASVDELGDVGGMTQGRVDAIAPYVTVSSAR